MKVVAMDKEEKVKKVAQFLASLSEDERVKYSKENLLLSEKEHRDFIVI